jgi:ubiquinone/menaquinone biosynthesis C-methylase UbiE
MSNCWKSYLRMKQHTPQNQLVSRYFDSIASDYAHRYGKSNSYYSYFFNERIWAATEGLEFESKSVLDVGAGTGALYDFLIKINHKVNYTGTDISSEMLLQSKIPRANQLIGELTNLSFPEKHFDYIFLLGVTTYLTQENFKSHLAKFNSLLKDNGQLIISFTHQRSLDSILRTLLKPFFQLKRDGQGLIQQPFKTSAYSETEARNLLLPTYRCERLTWLNQTFTPLNHLQPRFSVQLARTLNRSLPRFLLPFLSADFLVHVQKSNA